MQLDDLREEINLIDKDISKLLERRLELVLKIGKIKSEEGMDVYNEEREKFLLNMVENNVGEFSRGYVKIVYKKIFEISRECQENEKKYCKR